MQQDRNVQEYHISCTKTRVFVHFPSVGYQNLKAEFDNQKTQAKSPLSPNLPAGCVLPDRQDCGQATTVAASSYMSPYYLLHISIHIYSGMESFYPTYHTPPNIQQNHGDFVVFPHPPRFCSNLVQIQSRHGAIEPELGELLGVTAAEIPRALKIRLNSKVCCFQKKITFKV